MNKKLLVVAGVVGLGAIIAAGFYFSSSKNINKYDKNEAKPFAIEKKELPAGDIPIGIPKNLPIEKGSEILQNYESTTTDGRIQSTRVSTTNVALEKAKNDYREFFISLGWTDIPTNVGDTNTATALLRQQDDVVTIVARNNVATKERTVEITVIQVIDKKN